MLYNNYDLQRGDRDGDACATTPELPRWGGNDITAGTTVIQCTTPASGAGANISIPAHVHKVQLNLLELGFFLLGDPSVDTTVDGEFGRGVEWAVREFQIYAKMEQVARVKADLQYRDTAGDAFWACSPSNTNANDGVAAGSTIPNYKTGSDAGIPAIVATATTPTVPAVPAISHYVKSLESVTNGSAYTGRISGVVNQATRETIEYWLENDYRCPVVIEAWNRSNGARSTLNKGNLWKYDDMTSTNPRVYFWDFTNYYTYPATQVQEQYHVFGDYSEDKPSVNWSGGGNSIPPRHTWVEAEILPDKLISSNITLQNFSTQATSIQSTYRVVRAVSEVECLGFFDSLNAYDNAFISLGPCHWTLGIINSNNSILEGELGGYLAYLRNSNIGAYNQAIGNFGLIPSKLWGATNLFNSGQRKYTTWYQVEDESGDTLVPQTEVDGNFLKSWHWFFRYSMAGRTISGWQLGMWDMARIRLRDILDTEWSSTDTTKIGDIFTSEQAIGIILRWHIRYPAHMVSGSNAGTKLINSLSRAQNQASSLNWTLPKANWTDAYETALCDALWYYVQQRNSAFQTTISQVKMWPVYAGRSGRNYKFSNGEVLDSTSNPPITLQVGSLSTDRNSFELEAI